MRRHLGQLQLGMLRDAAQAASEGRRPREALVIRDRVISLEVAVRSAGAVVAPQRPGELHQRRGHKEGDVHPEGDPVRVQQHRPGVGGQPPVVRANQVKVDGQGAGNAEQRGARVHARDEERTGEEADDGAAQDGLHAVVHVVHRLLLQAAEHKRHPHHHSGRADADAAADAQVLPVLQVRRQAALEHVGDDHRGDGVETGVHRGHRGGKHAGGDEARHPGRQHLEYKVWKHVVCLSLLHQLVHGRVAVHPVVRPHACAHEVEQPPGRHAQRRGQADGAPQLAVVAHEEVALDRVLRLQQWGCSHGARRGQMHDSVTGREEWHKVCGYMLLSDVRGLTDCTPPTCLRDIWRTSTTTVRHMLPCLASRVG
mmetsp:Transcript_38456/g.96676  ORF Transcript_38456/g.96676 Transcript_38456/m.96676 type:complete len:369 (+) Transcript_38456:191-1297(+)